MAEQLVARSALRRHVAPVVAASGPAGVTVTEISGLTLATVAALRGREAELEAAVKEQFGIELPKTPKRVVAGEVFFAWAGPGKWLAGSTQETDFYVLPAAVSDQSDGRTVISVSGLKAAETLATLIGIDLHPRVFGTGDVAMTHAASIAVHMWRADDAPTYELVCFRTFAATLWRWIVHAGASRGVESRLD